MITAAYLQVWMLLQKDPIGKHLVQRILTPCEKPAAAGKINRQQENKTMKQHEILKIVIYYWILFAVILTSFCSHSTLDTHDSSSVTHNENEVDMNYAHFLLNSTDFEIRLVTSKDKKTATTNKLQILHCFPIKNKRVSTVSQVLVLRARSLSLLLEVHVRTCT